MKEKLEGSNENYEIIKKEFDENKVRQNIVEQEQLENLKYLKQEIQDSNMINEQLVDAKSKGEEQAGDKDMIAKSEELHVQVLKLKEVQE